MIRTPAWRSWLITMMAVRHFIWAVLLLISPHAQTITALYVPLKVLGLPLLVSSFFLVSLLVLVAKYIVQTHFRIGWWVGLAGSIGQQFLVMLSATGALLAILQGKYLDGTVVDWIHIFGDQDIYIIVAFFHAIALMELYTPWKEGK